MDRAAEGRRGRLGVGNPLNCDVLSDCVPASVRVSLNRAALQSGERALPMEVEALHA